MTGHLNQLAIKYRPTTFEEVVGHPLSVQALQGMVETRDLPTGLLFTGASGSGKTTLARIVASSLDSDVVEVDAASHGGVAEVRRLLETLRYSSGKAYKTLILDEAHSLTRDAFNALLKSLEEPPEGVLFILVTTDPQKLPKTVRTRLVEFDFRPLTPTDIAQRMITVIKAESIKVSGDIVKHIAMHSEGSLRLALTDLGLCASAGITSIEDYERMTGEPDTSVMLLQKMEQQQIDAVYRTLDESLTRVSSPSTVLSQIVTTLKDMMILRVGDTTAAVYDRVAEKKELARILEPERVFSMLRILWDLKTQVRSRGDSKQDLELAVALLYDVMNKGRDASTMRDTAHTERKVSVEDTRELTLDEISNLGAL